jgi:hypothetical protein
MKYVENVLLKKELFNLYRGLISSNTWNLARHSVGNEIGTFPGFSVRGNYTEVYNHYWNGYFTSLFERIKIKFFEKYNYELPSNIMRIDLGAKNETSIPEFHRDAHDNNSPISILGFLTPVWAEDWGGSLQLEENKINFEPGKFMIFDSNKIHNGVGPNKKIPYWRISINYIVT